jgi:hypothetical protein
MVLPWLGRCGAAGCGEPRVRLATAVAEGPALLDLPSTAAAAMEAPVVVLLASLLVNPNLPAIGSCLIVNLNRSFFLARPYK